MVDRSTPEYLKNVRHVFPLKALTAAHNEMVFQECTEEKVVIKGKNTICGSHSQNASAQALITVQTSEKHREIHGLLCELKVGVGLMYAVSCNLQTSDGLINGAECQMKKIEYRQGTELPAVLWVKFADETIGRQ